MVDDGPVMDVSEGTRAKPRNRSDTATIAEGDTAGRREGVSISRHAPSTEGEQRGVGRVTATASTHRAAIFPPGGASSRRSLSYVENGDRKSIPRTGRAPATGPGWFGAE